MSDQNDFFNDTLDDELEPGDPDLLTEAEEDELPEIRTAVMSKDGMLALLSLKISTAGGQLFRVDPRQSNPTAQDYEDGASATEWFRRSLATSEKNGWDVIYDGRPLFG